ncbi:UNVERIFIED_CONTAM: hypothetical protein H355_011759, partial [Colinus virginianus]
HASKSLPSLAGSLKQITSPPGYSKVSSTQARPPSPGNIRPVKKDVKPENEKKRPEKEPEKASEERTEERKETSAGAGESPNQEELTVQAEAAQGKEKLLEKKEELSQRIAEERARREEEEARRQEAERKRKDAEEEREKEERLRRQAEEREQKEKEEMERIQKQRLEEIMRRTRRVEAVDKKPNDQQNGHISKANSTGEAVITSPASPLEPSGGPQLQHATQSPHSGKPVTCTHMIVPHQPPINMDSNLNPEKNTEENGMSTQNDNFEEIINLPIGSKPSRLDALNNDGNDSPGIPLNPILAFEDKGTLLPQVDSVQTHQTAEFFVERSKSTGCKAMYTKRIQMLCESR